MKFAHIIEKIARRDLGMETLKTRNSDRLDFHDLHVGAIKRALDNAFIAGMTQGEKKP